jgi:hypothetical protein
VAAEKHVNWFALEKACSRPGCPLCTIVSDRSTRYIDNMLFEHVSDRGFRAKYRDAGGFCSYHARNLDTFRDGLAVAILGADILADTLPDLKKRRNRKYKDICPACAETDRVEREFLQFIAEIQDQSFGEIFTASDGLCVPHYKKLVTLCKRIPPWLEKFQIAKLETLLDRSRRFIDCSAWGRQDDFAALSDNDKVVWKELALALRGSSGFD